MKGVNAMLEQYYRDEVPLKTEIAELAVQLYDEGVKLCIATATDRYLVDAALSRLKIRSYFSEIFTCNEVGHGKDESHIFETALSFLGTGKAETFVFDDALYAIRTAKNAGFPVVAIYDFHETRPDEVYRLADWYLGGEYVTKKEFPMMNQNKNSNKRVI